MPRDFASVWDALSPEIRSALLRHPARTLVPEEVDALARAGGRDAHALWLENRAGRPKQWKTSWEFRRFVEQQRDAQPRAAGPWAWRWTVAGAS